MRRKDIRIKYSDILNPEYVYMKMIPSSSITNYDSSALSILANELFKNIIERIHFLERRFFLEEKTSIRYMLDISTESVNFYYIIPKEYKHIALDTISKIWNSRCTVQEVSKDSIRVLDNPTIYEVRNKYEDFLSIKTDSKSNKFLFKALSILEIMKEGDNVQLVMNLVPYNRRESEWKTYCNDIYSRYKNNLSVQKRKVDFDFVITLLKSVIGGAANLLLPDSARTSTQFTVPQSKNGLKDSTINKAKSAKNIVDTQIAVLTKSDSKKNERMLAKSFCSSFKEVTGDNELITRKTNYEKSQVSPHNSSWNIYRNKFSGDEISNFLTIAGQGILKQFKNIEHISSKQTDIIPELSEGICILGTQTFKDITQTQYLNEYDDFAYLPIVVLTKMGGGKSTWFETIGVASMNNFRRKMKAGIPAKKESFLCLDFIKQNELSYNIMYNMDPRDIILIDLSKSEGTKKLGFYFKEVEIDYADNENRIKTAAKQGKEMMKLINTLNEGISDPLTAPMIRYLNSAFQICYIHPNKSLKDAMRIIEDYETRHQYIDMIPEDMKDSLFDEIKALLELDSENKGTKSNLISGILARAYTLQSDPILKQMYNAKPDEGINLLDALQEGKGIFVLMPDDEFDDTMINIVSTYVVSRLFFVCRKRGTLSKKDVTRCTLLIDEVNIAPGCLSTLNKIINKLRKYKLRTIISAHNFYQIQTLRANLTSAGVSVVLPQGTHKSNFLEFENDFRSEGFFVQDLKTLRQWETLNLMETSDGKRAFISKLPPPVPGKIEDRDDITLSEFKEIVHERIRKANTNPNISSKEELEDKKSIVKHITPANNLQDNNINDSNNKVINLNKNINNLNNIVAITKDIDRNIKIKNKETENKNNENIKDLNDQKFNDLFDSEEFKTIDDDAFNI